MKVDVFVKNLKESLDSFEQNLTNLKASDRSERAWMDTFLAWSEWTDEDMKQLYWDDSNE